MDHLAELYFAQPACLALTLLVPAWLWLAWRRRAAAAGAGWVLNHPQLAPAAWLATPGQRLPLLLQGLAALLCIVALAQPREAGEWLTPPPQGRDIALVIDTSLTMSLEDYEVQGRPVSRMAMLKTVLGDFVQARAHDRFALLAFGTQAGLLTPPTFDQSHVRAQLQRLQVGVAGDDTALGDALGLALKPLRQDRLRPVLILVSDGEPSNSGELSPAEAVAVARQLGVAVHTLQIGRPSRPAESEVSAIKSGASVQPDLSDIARLTGGQHWKVHSTADATAVMQAIDRLEPTLARPAQHRVVREWFGVPLALGVALFVLARLMQIRRGRGG